MADGLPDPAAFGSVFEEFMRLMVEAAAPAESPLADRLREHLGAEPAALPSTVAELPTTDDPRPVSHCLLAVAPVAVVAGITQSERLHGLAVGMLAHYLRDLGVGSGVPLLWPLTSRSLNVPYAVYLAACVALVARAAQTLPDGPGFR